ncbi:MAG: hypothetical protein ACOZIN_13735 [Myxococcota bacterium]
MGKNAQRHKDNQRDGGHAHPPASLLRAAFEAYEAGDVVQARRAAKRALADFSPADKNAAKELGKKLFADSKVPTEPRELAEELLRRTEIHWKPYVFAGVALAIILLMIVLAALRA